MSTQSLAVRKPKQMLVRIDGRRGKYVSAKDIVLWLIGQHGASGGKNHLIELGGSAIGAISIEERMTICNMIVEFGAWTAIAPPDDRLIEYMAQRPYRPTGEDWNIAESHWRSLRSDEGAAYDAEISVNCDVIEPQVTWGTSSEHVIGINGRVPDPTSFPAGSRRASMEKALRYSEMKPGDSISGVPIEAAYIGSCTNSRTEDIRQAVSLIKGRKVAEGVKAICVPGSTTVKQQAEAEGLDVLLKDAGFEWREAGCGLCFFAGGDNFGDAKRVITSTNRNFENRQGPGVRSHLASPATVMASALAGVIADPRTLGE